MRVRASLATVVLAAALAPVGAAAAPAVGCHGQPATIVGTDGRDRLTGTPGRDVVAGLRGNDRIRGLGGNDVLCGGRGADALVGGAGDDRLFGGPDLVEGGETPYHRGDTLAGGPGDDLLDAGTDARADADGGGDALSWSGSPRAVHVDLAAGVATGEGHDRVRPSGGSVHLTAYDDTFVGTGAAEEVHAMGGADTIRSRGGDDVVWLDDVEVVDDDDARTGSGDDDVWSLGGSDVVRTQAGRDSLHLVGSQVLVRARAGRGGDLVELLVPVGGGHVVSAGPADDPGRDLLRLEVLGDAPGEHAFDLATGALLLGPQARASMVDGFEDAELYQGRFTIRGTDGPNRVLVNRAAVFDGLGGDDSFGGSPEDDTFDGGPGDDTYLADGGGTNTCVSVEHDPLAVCAGP